MNKQLRDIFFQLLRIGLWGEGKLTLIKPLSIEDWISIQKYACNQTVEGVIYDSFPFLTEDQLPPASLRLKWAVRMDQIERHNAKMNAVIAEQFSTFEQGGIRPILQKGQGVACYYRIPEHRICGDIDWGFEEDDYSKARNYLRERKVKFKYTPDFSFGYDWNGVHVEHHERKFDFYNPFKKKYLNKLLEDYRARQEALEIHGISIRLLAPELQLLQVNIHILKHLITYGISLRQFCDSARLYYSELPNIDVQALHSIYKKTGMLKWTHLLHKLLVDYIGLPESAIPFAYPKDTRVDWMLDEVWHSGNFGFNDERFVQGKKTKFFYHPDASKRLWGNFKRYLKYAPQEVIAFPIFQVYCKFLRKDSD
ncbi:nucleotidyltransferase family protein [Sphingobacterium sp. BIGb0116]|uniref:nucleotidyltransferase domain-containing protein n=1 Tax=Sphingobacterium sp. BIGb0116 TaxID=2940619 RepID=UPI00216A4D7C|nr:nucleotidyltransferase family protein [Sphingobacterium sp. BIGb0116]MCS4166249.1 hypothetical protein [Sphingobacterium sp. BIGb0116]